MGQSPTLEGGEDAGRQRVVEILGDPALAFPASGRARLCMVGGRHEARLGVTVTQYANDTGCGELSGHNT
jgi:hypothetical protein